MDQIKVFARIENTNKLIIGLVRVYSLANEAANLLAKGSRA